MEINPDKTYLVMSVNYQCFTMWCRKYNISPYAKHVRYIDRMDLVRGYNPKKTVLVFVCMDSWIRSRAIPSNMIDELRLLEHLGAETTYDQCINVPERKGKDNG